MNEFGFNLTVRKKYVIDKEKILSIKDITDILIALDIKFEEGYKKFYEIKHLLKEETL